MRVQACSSSSQHLSIGNGLSVHLERGVGLEASYHCETDFTGGSEAFEGRAQY